MSEVGNISGKSTFLVDKATHARIQKSDIPSMQQREEDRKPNTITMTVLTSKDDDTSSNLSRKISGSDSILEGDSCHNNNTSIIQNEAAGSQKRPSNLTSDKKVIISRQDKRIASSNSNLKEESCHETESGKFIKRQDTLLILDRDIGSSHQARQRLDKDSILKEGSRQVKIQKTIASDISRKHSEGRASRQEMKPTSVINNEVSSEVRRVPGEISTLMEQSHHDNTQTTNPGNNQRMHMKKDSNILGILKNTSTPEGNTEGVYKDVGTKMFRYEELYTVFPQLELANCVNVDLIALISQVVSV